MQEIDWKGVPPLGGYVATTLKSTAELVLMSHQEDPVLATWRYGLGRSVAFTSDAKAKWGVLWLRWREFNRFWAQLIRWTLRSGSRSDTVAFVGPSGACQAVPKIFQAGVRNHDPERPYLGGAGVAGLVDGCRSCGHEKHGKALSGQFLSSVKRNSRT